MFGCFMVVSYHNKALIVVKNNDVKRLYWWFFIIFILWVCGDLACKAICEGLD